MSPGLNREARSARVITTSGSHFALRLGANLPRATDIAAISILMFEVLGRFASRYSASGTYASESICLGVVAYFLVRSMARTRAVKLSSAGLIALAGAWEACTAMRQFIFETSRLRGMGFTDFLDFRTRLIHPMRGWVPGECFTFLLLALAFSWACSVYFLRNTSFRRRRLFAACSLALTVAITGSLCLSLSRAVFWSMLLLFLASCVLMSVYGVLPLKRSARLFAGVCLGVALVLGCASITYPGILKTYLRSDTSQTRSTRGRLEIWKRSAALLQSHPVLGVGSSNAALFMLSTADQEGTNGFASRSFSLPVQIVVEKGILGFAIYAAFLMLVIRCFHLSMRSRVPQPIEERRVSKKVLLQRTRDEAQDTAFNATQCCFAAGILAVLFRELTYSSLFEHTLTSVLVFTLAALACGHPNDRPGWLTYATVAVATIVFTLQWPFLMASRADSKLTEFYLAVSSGKFAEAREKIEEAIRLRPSNGRYYAWRAYSKSQNLPSQCVAYARQNETHELDRAAIQGAIQDYRHSLQLNARDAVAHHNLAWLEHLLGDDSEADRDWREAIDLDPSTAIFHLSYGMFLEEAGKPDLARAQYESAIEISPSILDSPFFTRYKIRNPQGAATVLSSGIAALEERLKGNNDPILEAKLGKMYLFAGNSGRASRLLGDAVKQLPDLPLAWFNLGELNAMQGNSSEAINDYKKANMLDGSLAAAYLRLGEASLLNGDKREASNDFRLAAQRWQRVNPVTTAHNNRLYDGPVQLIDDLLPTTLAWYATPCDASAAWRRLSELSPPQNDYARLSRTCEELPSPHGIFDNY